MAASTRPSIKVVKTINHRGVVRSWSNRYYMTGPIPSDATHWTTLSDGIVNAEKAVLADHVVITGTFGYAAGSDVPVFTKTYTTAGLIATGTTQRAPSEVVALVRYSTAVRTAKNHPVYLFNYYHGVYADAIGTPDTLKAAQRTALQTYAGSWVSGFSDGTNLQVRSGPHGQTATGVFVDSLLTHRDFPRA